MRSTPPRCRRPQWLERAAKLHEDPIRHERKSGHSLLDCICRICELGEVRCDAGACDPQSARGVQAARDCALRGASALDRIALKRKAWDELGDAAAKSKKTDAEIDYQLFHRLSLCILVSISKTFCVSCRRRTNQRCSRCAFRATCSDSPCDTAA